MVEKTPEAQITFIGYALSQTICHVAGLMFPAYASFQAIESKDKTDDKQWLTYWIVYGFFHFFEFFAVFLLQYFPFYWEIKIAFILWLQLPQTRGAYFLYKNYLEPFLIKNQDSIEAETKSLGLKGLDALKKFGAEAFKRGSQYLSENEQVKKTLSDAVTNVVKSEVEKKMNE